MDPDLATGELPRLQHVLLGVAVRAVILDLRAVAARGPIRHEHDLAARAAETGPGEACPVVGCNGHLQRRRWDRGERISRAERAPYERHVIGDGLHPCLALNGAPVLDVHADSVEV